MFSAPLTQICTRDDAQRRVGGFSPVNADVVDTVLDRRFWDLLDQLVRSTKPIVDAIGNLESQQATLADCMLELIRCAKTMTTLSLDAQDSVAFFYHVRQVFNRRFYAMDTEHHSLALFLHPLTRRLALSQAASGRSFETMLMVALKIVKQWRWSEQRAALLVEDMKAYHQCKGPFSSSQANALEWWESLTISSRDHPLKALAVILHSIVPHAAEVERLFSALGMVQTARRAGLDVNTFEALGKMRSYLSYKLKEKDKANGKDTHRRHGHMHTGVGKEVNVQLVDELESTFSYIPPLGPAQINSGDGELEGPESVSMEEFDDAFEAVIEEGGRLLEPAVGVGVLEGNIYDWEELERVERGIIPQNVDDEVQIVEGGSIGGWDVAELMGKRGFSTS